MQSKKYILIGSMATLSLVLIYLLSPISPLVRPLTSGEAKVWANKNLNKNASGSSSWGTDTVTWSVNERWSGYMALWGDYWCFESVKEGFGSGGFETYNLSSEMGLLPNGEDPIVGTRVKSYSEKINFVSKCWKIEKNLISGQVNIIDYSKTPPLLEYKHFAEY